MSSENLKKNKIGFIGWPLIIVVVVFILDLITKEIALHSVPAGSQSGHIATVVSGFFDLVCWFNRGGAWGVLSNHTEILTLISLIFGIGVIWKFAFFHENNLGKAVGTSLLIGGIWGNCFDRAFRLTESATLLKPIEMFCGQWSQVLDPSTNICWGRGNVVDFLFFHCQIGGKSYNYPAFNVADIGICVGVGCLIFFTFFFNKEIESVEKEEVETKDND